MSSPRGKRKASSAKGKKKSEKKAPTTTDLEATDKLVKAGVEIEVLLRELEHNNELKDRLASRNGEQKGRIERLEDQLENRNVDRAEITSDMSRQYKSMQAEMMARISALESINADLKQKLSLAQQSLQDTAREYERKLAAREEVIDDQNVKIAQMSAEFESMLNETLTKMTKKLDAVSLRWKESDAVHLSEGTSKRLSDFHLSRLTSREAS